MDSEYRKICIDMNEEFYSLMNNLLCEYKPKPEFKSLLISKNINDFAGLFIFNKSIKFMTTNQLVCYTTNIATIDYNKFFMLSEKINYISLREILRLRCKFVSLLLPIIRKNFNIDFYYEHEDYYDGQKSRIFFYDTTARKLQFYGLM